MEEMNGMNEMNTVNAPEVRKKSGWKWYHYLLVILGGLAIIAIAAVLLFSISFRAGSSADSGYYEAAPAAAPADTYAYDVDYAKDMPMEMTAEEAEAGFALGTAMGSDSNSIANAKSNVKLIYRASLSMQTEDLESAVEQIKALTDEVGGYIESSYVYNGSYYDSGEYKNASYTIRVPQKEYSTFLGAAGDIAYVTDKQESVEDIGLEYFDTETRLATLKAEQKSLTELLGQATSMSDIIELKRGLTEIEYEIDSYTSQLNRYDSLINYSTVSIYVEQVVKVVQGPTQQASFGERFINTFERGVNNFLNGLEDFFFWITYNIFTLLLIAVIAVAAVIVVRIVIKKKRARE